MGNSSASRSQLLLNDDGFARYNQKELTLLDRMFQDLAKRSSTKTNTKTMSKETFLQYFSLPGILGERLFTVFDTKQNGVIDFEEFVSGLSRYNHGSLKDKIKMLFEMYDMDGKQQVNREELSLILYSVITPTTSLFYNTGCDEELDDEKSQHVSELTRKTVEEMVNDAFTFHDTDKNGLLSQDQFTNWVDNNPAAVQLLRTIFIKHVWSIDEEKEYNISDIMDLTEEKHEKRPSQLHLETAMNVLPSMSSSLLLEVGKQGILWKIGSKFKQFIPRYYVIKEKFVYTFKKENDKFPINILFIVGWYIKEINDKHIDKNWYGVELRSPTMDNKILYSKSKQDRDEWLKCFEIAADTGSINGHYKIDNKILGKGHFSEVRLGIHRKTGKEYAIKIAKKAQIDNRENMALRNEIAMMRLVDHPCIIHMIDVFEDEYNIYMVMPLAQYGDFFKRWKKTKIYKEDIAKIIIWKLLDATQYLHSLGIVHRDLKPENILCLDEIDDTAIIISDFGLSKFAEPHIEMTMPCGTLAYVAPEVISMKGYDKKVDLWSIGCIMHLLLRGILPFDGKTKPEIIEKTLNKKLNLNHEKWKKISDDGKDLINKLLIKDPINRISLNNALKHKWFDTLKQIINDKNDLALHRKITPQLHAVMSIPEMDDDDDDDDDHHINYNDNNNNNNNDENKQNENNIKSKKSKPLV